MNRALLVFGIAALTLTGCVRIATPAPEPAEEPTQQPSNCLTVHPDAQASIQKHLEAVWTDQSIQKIAAVPGPNSDGEGWFVAAHVNSQGDDVTAVWYTVNDPTQPGDNAFMSIDAMAETISDYLRPAGASPAMEGAAQAEACLS